MAHWLLQHNPARGTCGSGEWTVRRYRELITAGDDVGLWLSGRGGGVAAVGTITEAPHDRLITVDFMRTFTDRLIGRDELRADDRFRDALVLRMPAGSNPFPLTAAQWQAVLERVPPGGEPVAADAPGPSRRAGGRPGATPAPR
ncbi:EVE domain-containing protein [Actinoplanes sp. M2I2]|uniref:EVE domain-containing protein n=1 Tax=Actinoplanes sp. M2I2 TaxID=1734444 RepID=UPI0020201745|nr:EVE domain-containing protein [Actinoplanes sp. M2I2]